MLEPTRILLWRLVAVTTLGIGLVGVALPVLPTVPFLIVSAWAGGKGWPVLEQRLLEHAIYGPPIRAWRERGVVPRRAKWLATVGMCASAVVLQLTALPVAIRVGGPLALLVVVLWLWRRPEH